MKLTTLISHSAQLIGIINKSGMPSDTVASNYFRSKKYIGSKERRFISETVFLTLRNKYLCEYCFDSAFSKIDRYSDVSKPNNGKDDFGSVLTAIYLASEYNIDENFNIGGLFSILPEQKEGNLIDNLKISFIENYQLTEELSDSFFKKINEIFKNLENDIQEKMRVILSLSKDGHKTHGIIDEDILSLLEIRYSLKAWIIARLSTYIPNDNLLYLLSSLNQPAQLCVRLNSINTTRDDFIEYLKSIDIPAEKGNICPSSIKILKRVQLNQYNFFRDGIIEVQDEGSQLISYALAPEENSRILDACAGAGGKTLHIASLTNDKAEILAMDIDERKLRELEKRAGRFGYRSISTKVFREKDDKLRKVIGVFDFVLVDAPCSGMGTTRRSPMNKYKLNESLLQRLKENQLRILNLYSQFVAERGVLVYSTCSLMPDENQEVVNEFLYTNTDFEPAPLHESFSRYSINIPNLKTDDFYINLLPSLHGTDGFFIAKMKRKG